MTKFKIGDKVRVTKNQLTARKPNDKLYVKGDIDVITYADEGYYRVGSRGSINWINENDLELVEKAEDVKTKTEGEEMRKFKIGDKVRVTEQHVKKSLAYSFDEKRQVMTVKEVDGNIVVCDLDNKLWNYTTDEIELNDTVELVEGEEMNNYEKLMKFVRENEIKLADLNDVAEKVDELENLEFEIKDTKGLIEETEEELKRLYEELSELEDERNELLN